MLHEADPLTAMCGTLVSSWFSLPLRVSNKRKMTKKTRMVLFADPHLLYAPEPHAANRTEPGRGIGGSSDCQFWYRQADAGANFARHIGMQK